METIDQNSQFCFVVASFNNEINIKKNLTSLIEQTNTNWRCIYINDCSTDNTELLFFDLIKKYSVESKFTYIKNDKNYGQMYSKYTAYKLINDFEIVCILDGDDWLSDNDVVSRLSILYSDKNVQMLSSNHDTWYNDKILKKTNLQLYSDDVLINKQFRREYLWKVRHLKTGYAIFFKSIPKEYLTLNGEWLKVATDVAEYYSALELSNGKYIATDDVMYVYNKTNSLKYNTSYFRDESEDIHKTTLDHILALPPCKYTFPKTYIINMAKCTKKREYMNQQMLFQSNTTFNFIEAIDGSTNSETGALMKKYFEYMNVKNSSQYVTFDRSTMVSIYKDRYNFRRQHITRGSLGLIQSAFLLMSEFVKSDEEHALILEDDVYTMKNLDKILFINKELLKGKDLVYLGCHASNSVIFPEKSDSIFINVLNYRDLIYGTYSIIISKSLAQYILELGIDNVLRLNLSWDLLLNYIRDTEKHRFTFFLYFKQVFIPNVIKNGGINPIKDLSFYTKNKVILHDYFIPEVTNDHSENDIANVMSSHNESFFFEFINKVVYINLEDRVDRKEHVESQLSKYIHNSKIHRFNAIKHTRGAIGCGLSHIGCLEMAIAENWDNVFIAEDDLTWTEHFMNGHDTLGNLIRGNYDVIVLGGSFIKSYKDSFKLISCNCALAYIVNKSYYHTLLKCFKDAVEGLIKTYFQSLYAIDQAWKQLQRRDNWFIIKPNMCVQLPSYSNIVGNFTDYNNYFDRSIEYSITSNLRSDIYSDNNETYWDEYIESEYTEPYNEDTNSQSVVFRHMNIRKVRFQPRALQNTEHDQYIQLSDSEKVAFGSITVRSVRFQPSQEPAKIINNPVVFKPVNVNNVRFQPIQGGVEPTNYEQIVFRHMNVPKLYFESTETCTQPTKIEPVVFGNINLRKVEFGVEKTPIQPTNIEKIPFGNINLRAIHFQPKELHNEPTNSEPIVFSPPTIRKVEFQPKKANIEPTNSERIILKPVNIHNVHFQPAQSQNNHIEPTNSKPIVLGTININNIYFQPKELHNEPIKIEPVVFRPPSIRKVHFGVEEIPTEYEYNSTDSDEIVFRNMNVRKIEFQPKESDIQPTHSDEIVFGNMNLRKVYFQPKESDIQPIKSNEPDEVVFGNMNVRKVHFQPPQTYTEPTKPTEPVEVVFGHMNLRPVQFGVEELTDPMEDRDLEPVVFSPPTIRKVHFEVEEFTEPTEDIDFEPVVFSPPSLNKVFIPKSNVDIVVNVDVDNYPVDWNKPTVIRNTKFNIIDTPPSIPPPMVVSFKNLIRMVKTN